MKDKEKLGSIQGVPTSIADSHILLKLSSGKPQPICNLLIVDKSISEQWAIPEQDIVVTGCTTLAGLPLEGIGATRNCFGIIDLPPNTEIRVPRDFFTEKLFIIEAPPIVLPGSIHGIRGFDSLKFRDQTITPILPLKSEILSYLDNDDLEWRLSFEVITNGYQVKLRLPLSGLDGMGRDFEITRDYQFSNSDIEVYDSIPVLEIWPNFKNETWKAYYLYYDIAGQNTFYAKPCTKGSTTARTLKQNRSIKEMEITKMEYFPEALLCERTINSATQPIGIILLDQPAPTTPTHKTWKIGIDFDTFGTNVFVREDDDSCPCPIEFPERLFQVTSPGEANRASIYDNFIMVDQYWRRNSFLSIYQNFQSKIGAAEPLLDGHIYFLTNSERFRSKDPRIMTDLKWGSSAEQDSVRAFLEQICLQCSAEAVANGVKAISWRFSIPPTFSANEKDLFVEALECINKKCHAKTGLNSVEEAPININKNIAFARYFANAAGFKAPILRGTVFINIERETTNISIWQDQKNELKWQTSLLFAERDILLELIRFHPEFLRAFSLSGEVLNYLTGLKGSPRAFYAQLDAIIMQNIKEMIEKLPSIGPISQVKDFVNIVTFGLAGLFHYIGLLLNSLYIQNLYDNELMPNIYIGGNGATLFHWVAGGKYKPDSSINTLFKYILINAAGFDVKEDFKIVLSYCLKAEVAAGLVLDDSILSYQNSNERQGIIAGEDYIFSNMEVNTWNTMLTTGMIKNGLKVTLDLNQLHVLLERFNELAEQSGVSPMKYKECYFQEVRDGVNQKLAQFALNNEKGFKAEPIFISALKIFLALEANNWAGRE